MKFNRISIVLLFMLFISGCGSDSISPNNEYNTDFYIDDIIVMQQSDEMNPIYANQDTFIFDLSSIFEGHYTSYNDLGIIYNSDWLCDNNVFIYNYRTDSWDQMAYRRISYPKNCHPSELQSTLKRHLLSGKMLQLIDYLDWKYHVTIYGEMIRTLPKPSIKLFRINPRYKPLLILSKEVVLFQGLTYDGEDFFASSGDIGEIYRITQSAECSRIYAEETNIYGLAHDGDNLWYTEKYYDSEKINKIDLDGNIICQFDAPTEYPGAITYGEGKIWVTEYPVNNPRIFAIDPIMSCNDNIAYITDTLTVFGSRIRGLGWDGTNLLVSSDSIYVISTRGLILKSYYRPSNMFSDITWNGKELCILSRGVPGFITSDPVISVVKLR